MIDDFERCYKVMLSRDPRFDGHFIVGVRSTGIYCRPSCPARTPLRRNVEFFSTPAAAQSSGLRACKRCDPDGAPGSPSWNRRADVAGRAVRLIADGVVDREGVGGLADRLGFSERQLGRILISEVGASPIALARAKRAQSARTLIESTDLSFIEVSQAAGFGSVRQFNDTLRQIYGRTPGELRARGKRGAKASSPGTIELRLAHREPLAAPALIAFFASRTIEGVETVAGSTLIRTLTLPGGIAIAELTPRRGHVHCRLRLAQLADLGAAVARCRRLLDLDADPEAIDERLAADSHLRRSVATLPGLRVPGAVSGFELATRAVLGQQVTVPAARKLAVQLVELCGQHVEDAETGLTRAFPTAGQVVDDGLARLRMPGTRKRALLELARRVAAQELALDPGAEASDSLANLSSIRGIGPWTTALIAMRALGDPDVLLTGDVGVRRGAAAVGLPEDPGELAHSAAEWRPWRSYAMLHLWAAA